MARQSRKLTALEVSRIKRPGKHPLGESLYLQVTNAGTKSWLFRYSFNKRSRWMGLGTCKTITLAQARETVIDLKRELKKGLDPIIVRDQELRRRFLSESRTISFDKCAERYIEAHKSKWKSKKNLVQWENSLKNYASPIIGHLPVSEIDLTLVLSVLEPIWETKTETASRVRARIERILSWATVRGYREGNNPAIWKGYLDAILPNKSGLHKTKHFKAMPFQEIGEFMKELKEKDGVSYRALEFLVLTATRTNETLNAKWSEINFDNKTWTIPSSRMKSGQEHIVPLSRRALEILKDLERIQHNEFIFPGKKQSKPLSDMTLLMILRREQLDYTVHGFRSTFKDWASERTNFTREVSEMALAHTITNKVEAAYRRGKLLLKRRSLMKSWEEFCYSQSSENNIVEIPVATKPLSTS
ncbi:MAG: tyrosine-type recombinase/integrase [Bdellovibrionales bacterium]|nr:tyrosine-type recombinase/integrase [Bdellovibrionales bacterium]NQZ18328.1 tyrosine-type recombinase/integrase [Bdellovibrionales bacterium]